MKTTNEKLRKILFNEVTLVIAIGAFLWGILNFINRPDQEFRQDIALIKQEVQTIRTNDLPHIQNQIDETKKDVDIIAEENKKINSSLSRIEALLETILNQ